MERIVMAIDFSPDRATRYDRATMILAHVVDKDRPNRAIDADETAAWLMLQTLGKTLAEVDGIDAEPMVSVEDVAARIVAPDDSTGADLDIVGSHRSCLRDKFVGTKVK